MTLGSLFDGIAGFPLAAQTCGIETLWASEIEPSCIEITKQHFPYMRHLGSVTDIDGAEIPPVDIISFGSPCQDLSVAGKQVGLGGKRSGLFMEAVRIIKEMREATNGKYPAYAIWENVPGAFSSNKGEDFRRVIEALAEAKIPVPKSRKWAGSGLVRVRDRELAWRTINAQFWGVPQRRKRIYLIAAFGGRCAGELLFKPESLLGYTPQGRKEGKETSAAFGNCTACAGFIGRAPAEARSIGYQEEMSPTLRAGLIPEVMCAGFSGQNSITGTPEYYPECAPCVRKAVIPDCLQGVFEMSHADEVLRKTDGGICPTLQARMGTGGNQVPVTFCIAGNIIDRSDTAGANGAGVKEECSYTLNTVDRHAVACCVDCRNLNCTRELYHTLQSKNGGGWSLNYIGCLLFRMVARRLTPRECERLQGFPDDWTRYDTQGREIKDSPRYRALGNSIAVPCAVRVFRGIAKQNSQSKGKVK